jgi:hypothetical protein
MIQPITEFFPEWPLGPHKAMGMAENGFLLSNVKKS